MVLHDASRRRQKAGWILCIDAAFDGVPTNNDVFLPVSQFLSGGNPQLFSYNVDAGNHFRHWVFNLYARVHFDEIEFTVFIKKLKGTCAPITDIATGLGAALSNCSSQLVRDSGGWRFFDDFLVASLQRTVALA